jgi:uncharacterized protein (TIGR02145 family)
MAENLSYHANIGCWTYHDIQSDSTPYGRLYAWKTAKMVCPDGWHLPSDTEWSKLVKYLGGSKVAGGKMKEAGTIHWQQPNTGAKNESGFSALPSVTHDNMPNYTLVGICASFWSSTPGRYGVRFGGWTRRLFFDSESIKIGSFGSVGGLSIRCIKN